MDSYIVVDLETTGFSAQTCEVLEFGAWKIANGVVVDKFQTYVKPTVYVPRAVQELTGITNEKLKDAPTIEEIMPAFIDWCGELPFLGYNLAFDYGFLSVKSRNLGLDITLNGKRTGIDALNLVRKYWGGRFTDNTLSVVATGLGININGNGMTWHNAVYDAYVTKLVYDCLVSEFGSLRTVTEPTLIVKNQSEYGKVVNEDVLPLE